MILKKIYLKFPKMGLYNNLF